MNCKFYFEILSQEDIASLKGGTASVMMEEEEESKSGDGAKLICCIEIEIPGGSK